MRTKEYYVEKINNSPLFDIDKERDSSLYNTEKFKLTQLIYEYYDLIFTEREERESAAQRGNKEETSSPALEENHQKMYVWYSMREKFIEDCIKNYNKEKGVFLKYFNSTVFSETKDELKKNEKSDIRGAMSLLQKEERLINQVHRYLNSKHNNTGVYDVRDIKSGDIKALASALNVSEDALEEALFDNSNCVRVNGSVKNEDGEEISLFNTVVSKELSPQERIEKEEWLHARYKLMSEVFEERQERTKPILSELLTLNYLIKPWINGGKLRDDDNDVDKSRFVEAMKRYEKYSFYSAEVVRDYIRLNGEVDNKTIGEKYGKLESSVSRTLRDFADDCKRSKYKLNKN